jgi:hypothetical protein
MHMRYICECRVRKCVCVCGCAGLVPRLCVSPPTNRNTHPTPALAADPDVTCPLFIITVHAPCLAI